MTFRTDDVQSAGGEHLFSFFGYLLFELDDESLDHLFTGLIVDIFALFSSKRSCQIFGITP